MAKTSSPGLAGGDDLVGRDGDDWLFGGDGDDYLNGGEDDDVLVDDDEDDLNQDTLYGDDGDDFLIFRGCREGETDKGDGANGYDIAIIDFSDRGNEDWDLVTNSSGTTTIDADDPNDGGDIELRRVEVVAMFFGAGDDRASGRSEVNYVRGGDGDDDLNGGAGDDILYGEDDDDEIEGGSGVDWLDGGAGTDLAILDLSGDNEDMVFIADHAGDETGLLLADGTYLRNFERFHLTFGAGDDQIWLGELGDEVFAGSGNDVISLIGRGRNVVQGNSGVDRVELDYSWATDEVNYGTQSGDRTFYIGSRYADADDRVRLGSVEEYSVIGGQFDDSLYGGDASDELFGGQGDDRLNGNDGDDYLSGGSGDDDIILGRGLDWADGGSGHDTGDIDRGTSNLDFNFDYRLASSTAGVTLIDGTFIRSIESWESLIFGSGDDSVRINVGTTDRYDVQLGSGLNHLIIDHEGQTDVLTTRSGVFNTQASYLAYRGSSLGDNDIGLWGLQVDTVTVVGGFGADSLAGLAGSDVLSGNAGDDFLSGGAGDDLLAGGLGDDFIDGGAGQDVLTVSGDASGYRLLMNGDDFILKGPDGGDSLTGIESIRFGDGRVLELNRMYGPGVDARAWADGRIPEHLLSDRAPTGDDALTGKVGAGPEVLPAVDDGDARVWKDDDAPLVLPGAEEAFVAGGKGFGEPEVLPGVDDWTPAGVKGFDEPEVLPGPDGWTLLTLDRAGLFDRWLGQRLTVDEQSPDLHHLRGGGWGPDAWHL